MNTCKSCKFYTPNPGIEHTGIDCTGFCSRFPKVETKYNYQKYSFWCGEHKYKEQEYEPIAIPDYKKLGVLDK